MRVSLKSSIQIAFIAAMMLVLPLGAGAHVGSPDIFLEGNAGAYPITIVVRPPEAIPGVAQIEVRSAVAGIRSIRATPLPMTGEASKHPPLPDNLAVSKQDAQFFSGQLWLMSSGSWQIRIFVDGTNGPGVLSVPVPSIARSTRQMQSGMGIGLALFGFFLVVGVVAIAGASVREAQLPVGEAPSAANRRSGFIASTIALMIVAALLVAGRIWWNSEAADYGKIIYKPLQMLPSLANAALTLELNDPGWLTRRKFDDLAPDHGHLMHLYAIRLPEMDEIFHLHPDQAEPGIFRLTLPTMPGGTYQLFADIVHNNGFPETIVARADLPAIIKRPPTGDDAGTDAPTLLEASDANTYLLPDGYRMIWDRPAELHARIAQSFHFRLLDSDGAVPSDMTLYMGMAGHAAFIGTDVPGSVFAHVHPSGSVPMAALTLAQKQNGVSSASGEAMNMPGMNGNNPGNEVSFPYGFPIAGNYRIIVQMKHGATIETGIFDAAVKN